MYRLNIYVNRPYSSYKITGLLYTEKNLTADPLCTQMTSSVCSFGGRIIQAPSNLPKKAWESGTGKNGENEGGRK